MLLKSELIAHRLFIPITAVCGCVRVRRALSWPQIRSLAHGPVVSN